jgi:hypothetical protein
MKMFVLVLLLACSSGCALFTKYVDVPSKHPYIEAQSRPALPHDPPAWSDRETILVNYALDLEAKIGAYNKIAHDENVRNGYELAPDGGRKP